MDHREWRGICVSDFRRNFLQLSARITSGYVGIDEYFGYAGFVWEGMRWGEIVKVR